MPAVGPGYQVGQRVFGRHGATHEYFTGYVLAFHPDQVFPFLIDVGRAKKPIHVLSSELQSDLPAHAANADDIIQWLLQDADRAISPV